MCFVSSSLKIMLFAKSSGFVFIIFFFLLLRTLLLFVFILLLFLGYFLKLAARSAMNRRFGLISVATHVGTYSFLIAFTRLNKTEISILFVVGKIQ